MDGGIIIKTPEEIEKIRHAGKVLQACHEYLKDIVKPGISTFEVDQKAEEFIRSHEGCTPGFMGYHGYTASICASVNDRIVHGIPRKDEILQEGDIFSVDAGVMFGGFHTDACETHLIGEVEPNVRHFVKTTKKALNNAIKLVKNDVQVGDISYVIQKTLEEQGYTPVPELTGHGVGRDLHEPPEILNVGRRGTGPRLKTNMVIAIEPIATMGSPDIITLDDGWTIVSRDQSLAAHFEHTILVTENGHEILA